MKFVYVIYDPFREHVICVHDEPDMECDLCKVVNEENLNTKNGHYYLEEKERELKYSKEKIRNDQIDKIL